MPWGMSASCWDGAQLGQEGCKGQGLCHRMQVGDVRRGCRAVAEVWYPCRREQKHSQWEFPDWIPVAHRWTRLSDRYRGSRAKGRAGQVPAVSGASKGMGGCSSTPLCASLVGCGGLWGLAVEQQGLSCREEAGMVLGQGQGLCWGDWLRAGEASSPSSHLCLHSEAALYLPAEEQSPLFSIQREGIKDDGALFRLNRCVMGRPQGGLLPVRLSPAPGGCQGVPRPLWDQGLDPWVGQAARAVPWGPTSSCPGSAEPSALCHQQVQFSAAPPRAPGRLLLRGRPHVGHGVVPDPGGLGSPAVRGRVLPQEHGGDPQRVWAALRPCTPAALEPGCAADRAGVSGWGWGLPGSRVPPSVAAWVLRLVLSQGRQPQPEPQGGCAGGQLC